MGQGTVDLITTEEAGTLYGLFRERVRRSPDKVAYRNYDRDANDWQDTTWQQMADHTARWQAALAKENFSAGDRVALVMDNRLEWVVFDQAAMGCGLVTVPLYTDDRPDNVAYIIQDAGVRLLFLENTRHWKRLAPALKDCDSLQRIVVMEPDTTGDSGPADDRLRNMDQWLPDGAGELSDYQDDPHSLASIVYTSGTTGRPKGVMLSHHNMLADAEAAMGNVPVFTEDRFLSFLPLSHTFERTVGYYVPVMAGALVAHARSIAKLLEDLETIKPTALVVVPRIFEKVYSRVQQQLDAGSPIKRKLFNLTVKVGWQRFLHEQSKGGSPIRLLWPVMNALVASKITEKLGGEVRCAISGGAALPPTVGRTFISLGLNLLQGYGLTEFSPVASVNTEDNNKPDSIGIALPGVETKLGKQDELLLKGPGKMMGYWNNEQATREAIDEDGWLHTGDQAKIDGEHIYITGRIKEILVLSSGEKVPPADMEAAICLDPMYEQAMVLGENRAYLTAVIVLNEETWPELAGKAGVDPDDKNAVKDPKLEKHVQRHVRELLADFPGYAKVRQVKLSLEPWTPNNNMLTPTMKLKRRIIKEEYAAEIEKMYELADRY